MASKNSKRLTDGVYWIPGFLVVRRDELESVWSVYEVTCETPKEALEAWVLGRGIGWLETCNTKRDALDFVRRS